MQYYSATKSSNMNAPWGYYAKWTKSDVKVTQLCPTLCDPTDYIVHGVLQARILHWVAFPFCRGSFQPRNWTGVSCIAGGFFTDGERQMLYDFTHVESKTLINKQAPPPPKKKKTTLNKWENQIKQKQSCWYREQSSSYHTGRDGGGGRDG